MKWLCLFLLACSGGHDVLDNWSFSAWDGDVPRGWELRSGAVARAPTWHALDYGVELVDTGTVLTQPVAEVPECMSLEVVADVEAEASVRFAIDLGDDGEIDSAQEIPASQWAPLKFSLRLAPASVMRVLIEKRGVGRAALANLRMRKCE